MTLPGCRLTTFTGGVTVVLTVSESNLPEGARMRIIVDRDRCVGHGICESIVLDVFEVLDEGYVHIHTDAIGDADEAALRDAVNGCPSAALSIEA